MEPDAEARAEYGVAPPTQTPIIAVIARFLARAWVVGLLLAGAGFAGVAISQVLQQRGELTELRQDTGPSAYAVVAYRHELERQIRALDDMRSTDAVPQPPPRPALLEEIDFARQRNGVLASMPQTGPGVSAGSAISAPP